MTRKGTGMLREWFRSIASPTCAKTSKLAAVTACTMRTSTGSTSTASSSDRPRNCGVPVRSSSSPTPQTHVSFTFSRDGGNVTAVVPATYLHGRETDNKAQETLAGLLAPTGYHVAPAILPKKLLAVRSDLAAYGRNNVTYVAGLGSFHRLSAFYSDMPCDGDEWHELRLLDRCARCRLCHTLCPTGAIAQDRFLLHGERCIVFHNEKPWTVPFSSWVDPARHNCLVGCLLCQAKCPENRAVAGNCRKGAEFTTGETELILAGTSLDRMPASLAKKPEAYDLESLLEVLPRNLLALAELVK
jgi:epoxyqueuosine reductase